MRTKERIPEKEMVQLTLSSSLDQTHKIRVEVPVGTTIKQAAKNSGFAPNGLFDVFTPTGQVVTDKSVKDFSNKTLYIGVKKVAGGNDIDIILDQDPDTIYHTEPPKKAITFISAFDASVRHEIIPSGGQTLRQAAEMAGLAPRDGTNWAVFDGESKLMNDEPAENMHGQSFYVAPTVIEAGTYFNKQTTILDISPIRSDFPSIKTIKGYGTNLIWLELLDSRGRTKDNKYKCIIDTRGQNFTSYILNLNDKIRHPHVYSYQTISGTNRKAFLVCEGSFQTDTTYVKTNMINNSQRLSSYINHIQFVLNA